MDKDRKLKRYRRKDYREVVEFPVEIVGRDGVVRRYGFEESVRLYQRRMSYAVMRFEDDDVAAAEQGHCRSRIEQLRRSFFHLYGWTSRVGQEGPEVGHPAMAGELAAFLVRVFRESGRLAVQFTRLDARIEGGQLWWMECAGRQGGLLLYAYVFGADGPAGAHEAFVRRLSQLRASERSEGDAERMIAFHHNGDCGFVLTGRADDVAHLVAVAPDSDDASVAEPSPWDEIAGFVRRGDVPTAFLRCRWVIEGQPWHRDAYAAGAMLALALRRPEEAEDVAFVGTRYFARDGLLWFYLGMARHHQGRHADALAALDEALRCEPELLVALSLRAYVLWRMARYGAALQAVLASTGKRHGSEELAAHRGLQAALLRSAVVHGLFGVLAVVPVLMVGMAAWWWLLGLAVAAGVAGARLAAGVDAAARPLRHEDAVVGLQRIERRRMDPVEA